MPGKILTQKLEENGITVIEGELFNDKNIKDGKHINQVSAKIKFKKLKQLNVWVPEEWLVTNLIELGPNTGHTDLEYWENRKSSLPKDAKGCFSEILSWSEQLLSTIKQHSSFSLSEIIQEVKPGLINDYSQPSDVRLQHEEKARMGAIRLLEGAYLSASNQTDMYTVVFERKELLKKPSDDNFSNLNFVREYYEDEECIFIDKAPLQYRCLFVDDDGEESGWKMVLEMLLHDVYIDYVKYSGTDKDREKILMHTELSDFIILDLKLPSADESKEGNEKYGIELLDMLKESYPSTLVLVLTASDDSLWIRKSITHGAMEYFPKTNRDYYCVEEREYFTNYYNRFNKIINRIKDDLETYKLNDIYSKLRIISLQ